MLCKRGGIMDGVSETRMLTGGQRSSFNSLHPFPALSLPYYAFVFFKFVLLIRVNSQS